MAILGTTAFPTRIAPLNNIQPFTYRDGMSHLQLLEKLRVYLNDSLRVEFNEEIERIITEFNEGIDGHETAVNAILNNLIAQVNATVMDLNNRVGPVDVQHVILTDDEVIELDPVWPDNHPIRFRVVQDGTGGHTMLMGEDITGTVVANPLPGSVTEFSLVPHGNGSWTAVAETAGIVKASRFLSPLLTTTQGINNALAATPAGSVLEFDPGTYTHTGSFAAGTKRVRAYGCRFINTANTPHFTFTAGAPTVIGVTGTTRNFFADGDVWREETEIYCATVPAVKPGDTIKLVSDDTITAARDGDGVNESRRGEYLTVLKLVGNIITVQGIPRDTYTTNRRLAIIPRTELSAGIEGGSYEYNTLVGRTASVFTFAGLDRPVVKDVDIINTGGSGIQFYGCHAYRADNVTVRHAVDDPANGSYGYGILDVGSAFGVITGLHAGTVRHAYSDDSGRVPEGSDPTMYGSTYATKIVDSHANGTHSTAWDTHPASKGVEFHNTTATNCADGFKLRGVGHVLMNVMTEGGEHGISIMDENGGAHSYGHVIDGAVIRNPYRSAVHDYHRSPSHTTDPLVRDTRPSYMRNVTAFTGNSQDNFMNASRSTWFLENITVIMPGTVPNDTQVIRAVNSSFQIKNLTVNANANTVSGNTWHVFYVELDSVLDAAEVRVHLPFFSAGARCSALRLADPATGPSVRITDFVSSFPPAAITNANTTGAVQPIVEYLNTNNGRSSTFVLASDPTVGIAAAVRRTEKNVVVQANSASATTMEKLTTDLYQGKRVTIINAGAGALTVPHDAAIMRLVGSANKVVNIGGSVSLEWMGTFWQQNMAV